MNLVRVIEHNDTLYVNINRVYKERMGIHKGDWLTVELTTRGLLLRPLRIAKEEEVDHGTVNL